MASNGAKGSSPDDQRHLDGRAHKALQGCRGLDRSNVDRAFLAVSGVALLSANLAALAGFDPRAEGAGFDNPYLLINDPGLAGVAIALSRLTSILVLTGFLAIFAIRWARASGPARRIYLPVLVPSTVLVIAIMVSTITSGLDVPDDVRLAAGITQALARVLIPVGFLIGLLRTRMARSAIADLVVELGETPAPPDCATRSRTLSATRRLAVAYWSPDGGVLDADDGSPAALPSDGSGRAVTFLERDGAPLAAIIHDEVLLDDPALVASVASASGSRSRTIGCRPRWRPAWRGAGVAGPDRRGGRRRAAARRTRPPRRRPAAARFAGARAAARPAPSSATTATPRSRAASTSTPRRPRGALSELRELARGIHPQILTEAGSGRRSSRSPTARR